LGVATVVFLAEPEPGYQDLVAEQVGRVSRLDDPSHDVNAADEREAAHYFAPTGRRQGVLVVDAGV
jgi:hypothetical protein